jgi:hypothetical protein
MSLARATLVGMEVTTADVEQIPHGNLHVPRAVFARVWAAAEELNGRGLDWYAGGVVMTCRWVATATVRPATGPWRLAEAPVTGRTNRAYEELIEAEALAADVLSIRRPGWLAAQPGWLEGVVATFAWCWRGSGLPPIDLSRQATG